MEARKTAPMSWWNPRTATALQAIGLVTVFLFLSKDVERTMQQRPVAPEQTRDLAAWVDAHRR